MRKPPIALMLSVCGLCATPAVDAQWKFPQPTVARFIATVSDRGGNYVPPYDESYDSLFDNPAVMQVTKNAEGQLGLDERSVFEIPLPPVPPSQASVTMVSTTLRLSNGPYNVGLTANEAVEVFGYAGNGVVDLADMSADRTKQLLATVVGPSPDGVLSIPIPTQFLEQLLAAGAPFAGFMLRGKPGPGPVTLAFRGVTYGTSSPQLHVRFVYNSH